jgi:integrase
MRQPNRRAINPARLAQIWAAYAEFRRGQIAPSTYKRDYGKLSQRIEKMRATAPGLRNSIQIRDWLMETYSSETARRTIQQFNSACQWAEDSDMITTNPFKGVGRQLRPTRPKETNWAAFTLEERDRVIAAIDDAAPYYGPWVRFLFWTGCRPEEAAALRWEHVSPDCRELLITEALPIGQTEAQSTKNYRSTRFPCGDRLQRLVREQRAATGGDRAAYVIPGVEGGRMHYTNFQRRHWRPIVMELAERGEIAFYLSQYHTRHTWITGALQAGVSVQDVSYLARVSTAVIYAHYAARARRPVIPEF